MKRKPQNRDRTHFDITCSRCQNCTVSIPETSRSGFEPMLEKIGWRMDPLQRGSWVCALCSHGIDVNAIAGFTEGTS